ncbi:Crp/Fnr family transcriptional regulator [Gaoshiqia sp. Z1-71]|uniref:Crp/Fnr family transcriptional regulator n=1 Tax=Gaoshiqia hydrogeniformans TaxID=3290090 RepID=UPI003BF84FD6
MNENSLDSGYKQTLARLKEFFAAREPVVLKKGETFIDYGEQNRKLGILLSGLLYASYTAENGQEWISRFYYTPENSIVSSHETFMTGKKSAESIRAYEDSELIWIDRSEYEELLEQNPKLERMVRIMAEESYVQALRRVHALQSLSASQRVRNFVKEHSEIVSRVQRQHVASYLGIHRNIFTRILNKL